MTNHYSLYNINKLFIHIIDDVIISHSDKFIDYDDSYMSMMGTSFELLDEVRSKILGNQEVEIDDEVLFKAIFDRIYKFRRHRTPYTFDLLATVDLEDAYDEDYNPDSDENFDEDYDSEDDYTDSDEN